MKTLHKLILIILSCFCAVDLVLIQFNFFISCIWKSHDYSLLGPNYCNTFVYSLQSFFGIAASIGIGSIVGISAFYSSKKSVIIVLVLAGLYLSHIALYEMYRFSLDATFAANSNLRIMRPMTSTEMIENTIYHGILWWIVPYALIISAIIWTIIVLRKKMAGILR